MYTAGLVASHPTEVCLYNKMEKSQLVTKKTEFKHKYIRMKKVVACSSIVSIKASPKSVLTVEFGLSRNRNLLDCEHT